ncbi:prolyl-tRNA synthetase associated domain-containing protein [Enterococcus saccharolyticus]|uniref:prolyl-tRNA synthetase associated domain-containing protein n=1 Tax=Enterococcus saccharolyticus TaxID=41997 RepID=UPI0039E0CCD7
MSKQLVYNLLNQLAISYEVSEHPAVYTIDEMEQLPFPDEAVIAKNIFLRNAKGNQHYLFVLDTDRAIDIKALKDMIGSTRLSFASEERLEKYLGLTKGAVSPLGLLNDTTQAVTIYIDSSLQKTAKIGIHPNDNTATIFLNFDDLMTTIEATGHQATILSF